MRPITTLRPHRTVNPLLQYLCHRSYSTAPSLIKINDLPATHTGNIRILSLNRPEARNALSRGLLRELGAQLESETLEPGPHGTRVLVVTSESDACFCAGADLKERATFTQDETNQFLKDLRHTFKTLERLPIPTISAISSTALGGGLELALSTNFRVMASTATVGLPEARLGILPGAGGTYRLRRAIGENKALQLMLTGTPISGVEAYSMGLANHIVDCTGMGPTDARIAVLNKAVHMAQRICEGAPLSIEALMRLWLDEELGEPAVKEAKAYATVVGSEDRNEGLKAFKEKRKPVFTGN